MTFRTDIFSQLALLVLISLVTLSSCDPPLDPAGPGAATGNFSCYACNSYYSPTCADFFNNRSWELMPCRSEQKMCRKIVQEAWYENTWNVRYIRQCAHLGQVGYDEGRHCRDRVGTYRIKLRYCYCDNKDGCNGAQTIGISAAIAVPLLLCILRLMG